MTVVLNQHSRTDLGTVFTTFVNNTGSGGENGEWPGFIVVGIPLYVMLIGLLNAQYTLTGLRCLGPHVRGDPRARRPRRPRASSGRSIISIIAGFILLVSMNVGITPDEVFPSADGTTMVAGYQHALDAAATLSNAGPPVQIWIDAVGQTGGLFILFLVIGAQFYCGMSSVTANSRMIYAFARDGAIPGSGFWHRINKRTRTPTNSIWLAAVGAFLLGLPYLFSAVAYAAVTSIAVIGLYVAYVSPVFLRVRAGKKFKPGPWTLGRWGPPDRDHRDPLGGVHLHPVHAAAGPADQGRARFNYTPVVFLIVLGGASLWYAVSARKWFKGPRVQGTAEELAAIERDLDLQA